MKSFAETPRPTFTIPSGKAFPRAPAPREMFYLETDLPDIDSNMHVTNPWYSRGAYVYNGLNWLKLTDGGRTVKSGIIPACIYEVEKPADPKVVPLVHEGLQLTSVSVQASHRKARFSGTASAWIDVSRNGNVWLSVFRDRKLVGLAFEFVEACRPRTMTLSFIDCPAVVTPVEYKLTVNSDVQKSMGFECGQVHLNRSQMFTFDGMVQSALTLTENT